MIADMTSDKSETFLLELPEMWTYDRMKDIVSLRNCKTDEKSSEEDYLELEDIDSGTGKLLSRQNTLDVESAVTLFKKGDVLFGKLRPYLEKYYLAEFDGKCTGEILAFNTERINGLFLRYCIASPWFIEKCNALAYGAKMPRVNWATQLAVFAIPLPPEKEQRRIAAYLDMTCAAIDTAIEKKQKQLETLDALRKSIIHKAVTCGLDDSVKLKDSGVEYLEKIPRHWKVDRLKDIVSLRNFKTDESSEVEDYLELEDIEQGTGKILSKSNTLEVESAVTIFKKRDVLFGKLRPYLEKYYLADFDGKCTGEILAFEPTRIRGHFLLYCIASPWFIGQCNMLAYGAKMPRVNWPTQLAKINIPLPPDDEQDQIAAYLDVRCDKMIKLKKNINDQIFILEQYRKSLIHECVTGKRRITEDNIQRVQQY